MLCWTIRRDIIQVAETRRMKILVTGFNPFGGETVNPAYEAVKLLTDTIAGAEIIKKKFQQNLTEVYGYNLLKKCQKIL